MRNFFVSLFFAALPSYQRGCTSEHTQSMSDCVPSLDQFNKLSPAVATSLTVKSSEEALLK
jgi:hypothetical protein